MPQLIPNMTITATDASGTVLSTTTGVSAVAAAASIDGSLVPGGMQTRAAPHPSINNVSDHALNPPPSPPPPYPETTSPARCQGQADALLSSLDFLFQHDDLAHNENAGTFGKPEVKPNLPDLLANALVTAKEEDNDSAHPSPGNGAGENDGYENGDTFSRKRKQSPPSPGRPSTTAQVKKRR
jgi:hypothetical protein